MNFPGFFPDFCDFLKDKTHGQPRAAGFMARDGEGGCGAQRCAGRRTHPVCRDADAGAGTRQLPGERSCAQHRLGRGPRQLDGASRRLDRRYRADPVRTRRRADPSRRPDHRDPVVARPPGGPLGEDAAPGGARRRADGLCLVLRVRLGGAGPARRMGRRDRAVGGGPCRLGTGIFGPGGGRDLGIGGDRSGPRARRRADLGSQPGTRHRRTRPGAPAPPPGGERGWRGAALGR